MDNLSVSDAPSDEELAAQAQAGLRAPFEELVRRYSRRLYLFLRPRVGSDPDTEDLVQDTFLKAFGNIGRYDDTYRFSTWIYTIAGNLARTELRRRKIRNIFSISQRGETEIDYEIPDTSINVEKEVEGKIRQEVIMKEIGKLPVYFREVIILRDVQDLSYEEISQILKVPLGTVKSRVNRGRTQIQKRLKGKI